MTSAQHANPTPRGWQPCILLRKPNRSPLAETRKVWKVWREWENLQRARSRQESGWPAGHIQPHAVDFHDTISQVAAVTQGLWALLDRLFANYTNCCWRACNEEDEGDKRKQGATPPHSAAQSQTSLECYLPGPTFSGALFWNSRENDKSTFASPCFATNRKQFWNLRLWLLPIHSNFARQLQERSWTNQP